MKPKLFIVKIGGAILENEKELAIFLKQFSQLKGPKILIHGGGKKATAINHQLGIPTEMHKGRRITSKDSLTTIIMVYAGLINKEIVAKLQANQCNALGLSGADGNGIIAAKRSTTPIDFGYVGDITNVNDELIDLLLCNSLVPVFCAVSHNQQGQLLNTNADTIAAEIAISMSNKYDSKLIYCFEKKGVLTNTNDEDSLIKALNFAEFERLKKQGKVYDGMLPKLTNAFYAVAHKVASVRIQHYRSIGLTNPEGTSITL